MNIREFAYFGFQEGYVDDAEVEFKHVCLPSFLFEIGLYEIVITPMIIDTTNMEDSKFNFLVRYDGFTHYDSFLAPGYASFHEVEHLLKYIEALENHEEYAEKAKLYKPFYKAYASRY